MEGLDSVNGLGFSTIAAFGSKGGYSSPNIQQISKRVDSFLSTGQTLKCTAKSEVCRGWKHPAPSLSKSQLPGWNSWLEGLLTYGGLLIATTIPILPYLKMQKEDSRYTVRLAVR
jgi:hypothetical protein